MLSELYISIWDIYWYFICYYLKLEIALAISAINNKKNTDNSAKQGMIE